MRYRAREPRIGGLFRCASYAIIFIVMAGVLSELGRMRENIEAVRSEREWFPDVTITGDAYIQASLLYNRSWPKETELCLEYSYDAMTGVLNITGARPPRFQISTNTSVTMYACEDGLMEAHTHPRDTGCVDIPCLPSTPDIVALGVRGTRVDGHAIGAVACGEDAEMSRIVVYDAHDNYRSFTMS